MYEMCMLRNACTNCYLYNMKFTTDSQYSKPLNVTNILIIHTKVGVICFSDHLLVYIKYLYLVLYIHTEYLWLV